MKKIVVYHQKLDPAFTIQTEMLNELVAEQHQYQWTICKNLDEYFDAQVDAEIIWSNVFPASYPNNTAKLKWFQSTQVNLTIPNEAFDGKLILTNHRSSYAANAAEMVFTYLLVFNKELITLYQAQLQAQWISPTDFPAENQIESLVGKQIGIVGFGNIGQAIAKRAKAFDMIVNAADVNEKSSLQYCDNFFHNDILSLVKTSDFIVIALPLCKSTLNLVSDQILCHLKPTACLINLSPSSVLDEAYLLNMMKYGDIAAAAMDNFSIQPLPPIHPWYAQKNVILTPHLACYDKNILEKMVLHFKSNLEAYLNHQTMHDLIKAYD